MAGRGSKPGERRGGRKKGVPNKITRDLREALLQSFNEAGGVKYLVRLSKKSPSAYTTLLGKIIPTEIKGDVKLSYAQLVMESMKKPGE